MIAIIATFQVAEGKTDAFEAEFKALAEQVKAREAGNSLYQLVRAKRDPGSYRVMELYADKDAVKLHGATDYFLAAFERMKELLTAEPVIEMFDTVD